MLHERHDGAAEGRSLLAPLDGAAHARRCRRQPDGPRHLGAGRDPARRADVPRERVGLPVSSRRCSARSSSIRGRISIPQSLLDAFVAEARHVDGGRADDLARASSACSTPSPARWDLSRMKGMLVGGSAAPRAMIAGFKQRHGLDVVHGWGMTETSPVASTAAAARAISRAPTRRRSSTTSRCRGSRCRSSSCATATTRATMLPWDGEAMGELEIARPVGRGGVLRHAGAGGPLDGRRLVQDRRRRHDPSARLHPDQGPLEGRDQVGRRVDLVGRARERADGASRGRGGGGHRDARREVGRAAARGGRAA